MDSKLKPVPAFYCCYLLRSTIRHSSLYIGSSPHPARRLAQHNGKVKGGAVRTSRLSLRPWEMVCVVAGFPSNIAALQFEWAWHNPHLTKHISPEERLSLPTARTKTNAKTGKKRRRPGRPRTSLIDKLSNLHLLLRAPYFSKWPLELRFWSADVHKSWIAWTGRASEQVRLETKVLLDMPQQHEEQELARSQKLTQRRKTELFGSGGVEGVDPTSAKFQPVLRKLHILENDDDDSIPLCGVCGKDIDADKDLFNICLAENCHCLTHLSCLSARFLKQGTSNALVPSSGTCPSCRTTLIWIDLMRVLSLRTRADKEVKRLLKKKTHGTAATAEELLEDSDNSALEDDDDPEEHALEDASDDDMNSDSDDAASITSVDSRSMPKIVIEDSEDER